MQEKFLGQGPQDNESAIEQAKDEQISDYIRSGYKSATGSDIPIKDKVCSITPYRQLSVLNFGRRRGSARAVAFKQVLCATHDVFRSSSAMVGAYDWLLTHDHWLGTCG